MTVRRAMRTAALAVAVLAACDAGDSGSATLSLKNDFNNPDAAFQPPWTICEASWQGVEFGQVPPGATSDPRKVEPGLDYVLMVAAWDDPTCSPAHCLPLASRNEEEVVDGQVRTVTIDLGNHQGACPPEPGPPPIPEAQYERIRALYPSYGFKPYADRKQNPQCVQ